MIRDCVCSGDDKSRLISCQLKRYCKLNGKYIKLNEQEVIETETQEKIEILQTTTGTKTDCHHMGHMIWPIIWTPYRMALCWNFDFLKKQTCTCIEAARTSCIIEAKPITKKNQYQVEKH